MIIHFFSYANAIFLRWDNQEFQSPIQEAMKINRIENSTKSDEILTSFKCLVIISCSFLWRFFDKKATSTILKGGTFINANV